MSGSTAVMVKKWDVFEVVCQGRTEGNPFTDYTIQGVFKEIRKPYMYPGFMTGTGFIRSDSCLLLKGNTALKYREHA